MPLSYASGPQLTAGESGGKGQGAGATKAQNNSSFSEDTSYTQFGGNYTDQSYGNQSTGQTQTYSGQSQNYSGQYYSGQAQSYGGQYYSGDGQNYGTQSYSGQAQSYGGQAQSYGGQAQSYGGQAQSYGGQAQSYGSQAQSYGSQAQSYGGQNQNYGKQDQNSSGQAQTYSGQGQNYGSSNYDQNQNQNYDNNQSNTGDNNKNGSYEGYGGGGGGGSSGYEGYGGGGNAGHGSGGYEGYGGGGGGGGGYNKKGDSNNGYYEQEQYGGYNQGYGGNEQFNQSNDNRWQGDGGYSRDPRRRPRGRGGPRGRGLNDRWERGRGGPPRGRGDRRGSGMGERNEDNFRGRRTRPPRRGRHEHDEYMHGRNPPPRRNRFTEIPEEKEWGEDDFADDGGWEGVQGNWGSEPAVQRKWESEDHGWGSGDQGNFGHGDGYWGDNDDGGNWGPGQGYWEDHDNMGWDNRRRAPRGRGGRRHQEFGRGDRPQWGHGNWDEDWEQDQTGWDDDQGWNGRGNINRKKRFLPDPARYHGNMSKRGRGNRPGDRDYGQRYADNYDSGYHDDFGARGARSNVDFAPSLLKLGKEKRYGFEMEKFKNMKTSTVRFPSYEVEHYLRDRSSQIQVGRAKKKRALTMNHCVLVMLKHLSRNLVNQAKEEEVAKTEESKATDEADSAPKTEKDKVESAQSDTDKVEADKKKADIVNEIIQEYGEKSENLIEIFQVTINEILESRKKEDKLKQQLQEEGLVHYVQESDAEEMADADMNEENENVEAEELDYPEPEISPFKQLEGCDKEQRMIGVVGAGSANKKLMLQNVQHFENVVLFKHKVTKSFLNLFSSLFIETVRKEPKETARLKYYRINVDEENEVISIRNTDVANTVVDLRLSSTKYSETGESTSDEENPENGLNEKNCRDNLALIRRTRWFDRKMNKAPVKISVVRLFLAIKAKGDGWAAIPDWLIYYLVNIANDTGPYAVSGQTNDHVHPWIEILFHRTLEMIASGILLSKEHGFHDPCSENGLLTDTLTLQQLEEITVAAQRDLRKMAFSKHAEVLGPNEKVKS